MLGANGDNLRAGLHQTRQENGVLADGLRLADKAGAHARREIQLGLMQHPSIARYVAYENNPGDKVQSYDEWLDFARRTGQTTYHVIGTCKMGSDPMAVVDDRLRVHGIAGLRVIDASIMPTVTSGNTNTPTVMIAERGAKMILADQ